MHKGGYLTNNVPACGAQAGISPHLFTNRKRYTVPPIFIIVGFLTGLVLLPGIKFVNT